MCIIFFCARNELRISINVCLIGGFFQCPVHIKMAPLLKGQHYVPVVNICCFVNDLRMECINVRVVLGDLQLLLCFIYFFRCVHKASGDGCLLCLKHNFTALNTL